MHEYTSQQQLNRVNHSLFKLYRQALAEIEQELNLPSDEPHSDSPILFLGQSPNWPALTVCRLAPGEGDKFTLPSGGVIRVRPASEADKQALENLAKNWDGYELDELHRLLIGATLVGRLGSTSSLPISFIKEISLINIVEPQSRIDQNQANK